DGRTGAVYAAGRFVDSATFDWLRMTSWGSRDALLLKVDSRGSVEWGLQGGGGGSDMAEAVALEDGTGNVYVAASFGSLTATFGDFTVSNRGAMDCALFKVSSSGSVLWVVDFGGVGQERARGLATLPDASGAVITGDFSSTAFTASSAATLDTAGAADLFVIKVSASGTVMWAAGAGGSAYDESYSVAASRISSVVYLTGRFYSKLATFGGTVLARPSSSNADEAAFLAQVSSAGSFVWALAMGGEGGGEGGYSTAVDIETDNVYLTGYSQSTPATFGGWILTSRGRDDIFVAAVSSQGTVLWAVSAGGDASDAGKAVAAVPGGGALVTGWFTSPVATFGSALLYNHKANNYDGHVMKVSSAGSVEWVAQFGGADFDCGEAVLARQNSSDALVGGWFSSTPGTFGGWERTATNSSGNQGTFDLVVMALSPGGSVTVASTILFVGMAISSLQNQTFSDSFETHFKLDVAQGAQAFPVPASRSPAPQIRGPSNAQQCHQANSSCGLFGSPASAKTLRVETGYVTIDSITAGSVVVTSTVLFALDMEAAAEVFVQLLEDDVAGVFTSAFWDEVQFTSIDTQARPPLQRERPPARALAKGCPANVAPVIFCARSCHLLRSLLSSSALAPVI
ncbi:hypothetical protein CYMTET_28537, partial [Cymbomonas tetramitiformis]